MVVHKCLGNSLLKEELMRLLDKTYQTTMLSEYDIVGYIIGNAWVESTLRPALITASASLGYSSEACGFRRQLTDLRLMDQGASSTERRLSFTIGRCSGEGWVKVTGWRTQDIRLSYTIEEEIAISVSCEAEFEVFANGEPVRKLSYKPALGVEYVAIRAFLIGKHKKRFRIGKFRAIPLRLVWCWMNDRLEDESNDIKLEESDGAFLTYNVGKFPVSISRFFRRHGMITFSEALKDKLLIKETYEIITNRLNGFARAKLFLSSDGRTVQASQQSNSIIDIGDREAAVKVRLKYRKKLKIIQQTKDFHSVSQWTEMLGYGSNGATVPFIGRMSKLGLLLIEKSHDGTKLSLTEKAERLLQAS